MTVAIGVEPNSPSPARAEPLFQKNANKRWPPMANRNTLPYKLTVISKEKLTREATAPDPNLRRCVAHFRLHCGSVQWTENDMKSRISSFEFEETDDEEESDDSPADEKEDLIQKTIVRVQVAEDEKNDASTPPPSQIPADNGPILVQSQDCIDAPKNYCCVTVTPLAG
ncbi:hypothetical protein N7532_005851 [Penicillium argentinense]|uniref:Uncharacterized protein n=1 Tax=Penicillium argentinense TaxID=1131581 RepID=A0A9W9KAB7_9EURO|nr:uncharacterized protein N7532_005851 [Penicillium argentinense]KAJ5098850.1 hypothetical protein N7532_005851 [Penicillium argentinense]